MKDILIIGSVNIDYSIDCDRFPGRGETIRGQNFSKNIGGKGLNQAIAAFKYNPAVHFCGSVGLDQDALLVKDTMSRIGLSDQYLFQSNVSTGVAMILRYESDNSIVIGEGANGVLPFDKVKEVIDQLALSYVVLQMELPYALTKQILSYCYDKRIKVVLNTAPALEMDQDDFTKIDTLILNQSETQYYTSVFPKDVESASTSCQYFIEKGVRNVIVTLGSEGSYFTDGKHMLYQQAYKSKVVDTTGAGDAFTGVYVSALNEDNDIEKALSKASVAGSLTCEKIGAMEASPWRQEIINKIKKEKIDEKN